MGDAGERLVDAESRLAERMEEREQEKRQARLGPSTVDPERTRQIESKIDLDLLRRIAATTGGEMYQATDPEALKAIFRRIDELEKVRYRTTISTWHRERMAWFAVPGLALLLLESLLGATWLRRLP